MKQKHFCEKCGDEVKGRCDNHPSTSIETISLPDREYNYIYTRPEQVKIYQYDYSEQYEGRGGWTDCATLDDAIKEWNHGAERAGAHSWDESGVHVIQRPDGTWILLYR